MVRDIKKKGRGGEREIADRCFRRKNSGSQGEQATDPHLKNHRWREREGKVKDVRGVGSEHDTAKSKN